MTSKWNGKQPLAIFNSGSWPTLAYKAGSPQQELLVRNSCINFKTKCNSGNSFRHYLKR